MKLLLSRTIAVALLAALAAACASTPPPVEVIYGGTEHVCRCECPAPLLSVTGDAGYELRMAIVH